MIETPHRCEKCGKKIENCECSYQHYLETGEILREAEAKCKRK